MCLVIACRPFDRSAAQWGDPPLGCSECTSAVWAALLKAAGHSQSSPTICNTDSSLRFHRCHNIKKQIKHSTVLGSKKHKLESAVRLFIPNCIHWKLILKDPSEYWSTESNPPVTHKLSCSAINSQPLSQCQNWTSHFCISKPSCIFNIGIREKKGRT